MQLLLVDTFAARIDIVAVFFLQPENKFKPSTSIYIIVERVLFNCSCETQVHRKCCCHCKVIYRIVIIYRRITIILYYSIIVYVSSVK